MHASTFWGLDGRPIVLSIPSIPLFLSLGRVVRASHRAAPARKKNPGSPPNDHQFYQFHQFHRWGAFSIILAAFLATLGLQVLFEDRETLRRGDFVCMQAHFGDLMDDQ